MSQQLQQMKPLEARVQEVREEAPGVKSFLFKYDKTRFQYKSGQPFLLFPDAGDPAMRHAFSIASSPNEDLLMITTRIRPESPYKTRLNKLKPRDPVTIMGPGGDKFTLPEKAEDHIVFLGGGIGITPFRSMIKYATENQLPHKITLIYSNRIPEDIVYKHDWEVLQAENPNLTIVHTITRPEESKEDWQGRVGRIDAKLLREYVSDVSTSLFYVCGPPSMITNLTSVLAEMGVDPDKIRIENFRGYAD